jgi:iron complex transport system ATP-binding protein
MNRPILHINDWCVGYAKSPLLSGVNLSLEKGRLYLLVGNNGTGKSTLLKTLVGQLSPLSGTCQLYHLDSQTDWSTIPSPDRAKWMSYLPARHHYVQGVRVMDLLQIGRTPHINQFGRLSLHDQEKIESAVATFGLRNWLDKPLDTLSDGEQQKVRLARVVLQETPIIILDEPTSHLDIQQKKKMYNWLHQLASEGKTILCATHDLLSAFPFADDIVWVKNNTISQLPAADTSIEQILAELESGGE